MLRKERGNRLLEIDGRITHCQQLGALARFETLGLLAGHPVDWGSLPWQRIGQLVRLRNWLVHDKGGVFGLVNSCGEWLGDGQFDERGVRRPHKLDELTHSSVDALYHACLDAMQQLEGLAGDKLNLSFLTSEEFEPFDYGA